MANVNCYAHAVRYDTAAMDPGDFYGAKYTDNRDVTIKAAVGRDGLEFANAAGLPAARAGQYVVALWTTTANLQDYHWARMDGDRTWSHKPGQSDVRKTDADGTTIDDQNLPHAANMNFRAFFESSLKMRALLPMAIQQGWAINYDHFVGYFYCPNGGLAVQGGGLNCIIL
jgi:hypothetical protein